MTSRQSQDPARSSSSLASAASTDNKKVQQWAARSAAEIETFARTDRQAGAFLDWYFQTFCTGWGFNRKAADGSIFKCSYRLTPRLVADHLGLIDGNAKYFGISPSNEATWAIVDIDTSSRYHPASEEGEGIEPVIEALKEVGLNQAVELQSSFSSGIHLLYGLKQAVPTWQLAESLVAASKKAKLQIGNGVLEFFPNKKHFDSAYKCIRAPLSGDGNAMWIDGLGLDDSPEVFRHIFVQSQLANRFSPIKSADDVADSCSTNRRGQNKHSNTLRLIQHRLAEGFTSSGETQELQFAALQVARFVEGVDSIDELRKRASDLLVSAPGFTDYCGHQRAIKNGTYWSKSTLKKTLQLSPADYEKSWQKIANDKKSESTRQQALEAIKKARANNMSYSNRSAALKALRVDYEGPTRSWFYRSGADLLSQVETLVL